MFPQVHIRLLPLLVLILPLTAQAQSYPVTGTTALIPWTRRTDFPTVPYTFDTIPHARIRFSYDDPSIPESPWIQSESESDPTPNFYSFTVDTGTCGIVANKEKVNLHDSEQHDTNQGQQYLSSSKTLYVGYWVPRQVEFVHSTPIIKTLQPVLAVTKKFIYCEHWEESMGNSCIGAMEVTVSAVTILGIGYGRTYDGQPQGTPDKNPLLNIESIGGTAIDSLATFHPGWRIDANGVQVGLTRDIWYPPLWTSFTITVRLGTPAGSTRPFPPESATRNPHTPWSELRGTVEFPGTRFNGRVDVSLLLDTGLSWSSIRVDQALARAVRDDGNTDPLLKQLLNDNQIVDVRSGSLPKGGIFGSLPRNILETMFLFRQRYKHTDTGPVPGTCYWTPEFTRVTYDDIYHRPYFVNTGRNAFKVWTFAFDPWNGFVGFHRRDDTCAATIP